MTKYIWHTMGDDRVRSEHAARNGQIFDYDNPPEVGNQGDAPQFSDKEVMIRIYTERSNPGYFASQNTQNQHNISLRFPSEMKKVLKLSDNY